MSIEEPQESQSGEDPQATGNDHGAAGASGQLNLEQIRDRAIKVITDPVGFYQEMPKSGGLVEPLIFMVALGVVAGVLAAVLSLVGLGMAGAAAAGLVAVIMMPIFIVIFGFIGAGIAFIIWKVMGSQEDFETAFRCVAFTAAIMPVNVVLNIFPYIGSFVSALWAMALLAVASIHVHRREPQTSWAVFGILGLLLALSNVNNERQSRQIMESFEDLQEMLERQ